MVYLEYIDELDIFNRMAIIKICKYNREFITGFNRLSRRDLYKVFERLLEWNYKIKIPVMDAEDYVKYSIKSFS